MKRAMPAIEATGERQLMLFLPFSFWTYHFYPLQHSLISYILCFLFDFHYILWYGDYVIGICDVPSGYTRCLGLYGVRMYKVQDTLCLPAFLFAGICTLAGMIQDAYPVSILFLPF